MSSNGTETYAKPETLTGVGFYLSPQVRFTEVESLIQAAGKVGRHCVRDAAIILLMFRHGLRTAEIINYPDLLNAEVWVVDYPDFFAA